MKVRNISDWIKVDDGKALNFEKNTPRKVRLEVNSPSPVVVDYVDPDGATVFLGQVDGRGTLEFTTPGEFAILATGGELWVHTVDGEKIHFVNEAPVIFTKLVERRKRNPELERMEYLMRQNTQRMLDAQAHQLAALFDDKLRAVAASAAQPAAAGDAASAGNEPEPDKQSGAGGGDAAGDDANAGGAGKKK